MSTPDDAPGAALPAGARFDPVSGEPLRGGPRKESFALQPGEPVTSVNLVSSLLPLSSGRSPQTYRWALALGILIPVVAGALGSSFDDDTDLRQITHGQRERQRQYTEDKRQ